MADVIFVLIVVAFFGIAVLLIRACDAIIGPDPAPPPELADEEREELARKEHVLSGVGATPADLDGQDRP